MSLFLGFALVYSQLTSGLVSTMLAHDGTKAIIVIAVLIPLSTVFLGLRLKQKQKVLGPDDWVLCFGLFFFYLQAIGSIICREPEFQCATSLTIIVRSGSQGR